MNIFFVFAWGFGIERAGIFGEFIVVSVHWEQSTKNPRKYRGKIRSKIREKIRDEKKKKKRGTFGLQLF